MKKNPIQVERMMKRISTDAERVLNQKMIEITLESYKDAAKEYMTVWTINNEIGIYESLSEEDKETYQVSLITYICNKFDVDATLLEHYIAGIFTIKDIETALKNK